MSVRYPNPLKPSYWSKPNSNNCPPQIPISHSPPLMVSSPSLNTFTSTHQFSSSTASEQRSPREEENIQFSTKINGPDGIGAIRGNRRLGHHPQTILGPEQGSQCQHSQRCCVYGEWKIHHGKASNLLQLGNHTM